MEQINSTRRLANRPAVFAGFLLLAPLACPTNADSLPVSFENDNPTLLRPEKVVSTSGNVTNAEALVSGHAGPAVLTMAAGGIPPTIILDYGRDVGGLPVFDVDSVSGTPQLQAIYSESQQSLLPHGDASASDGPGFDVSFVGNCGAASLSRVNTFDLTGPGLVVNRLIQGGERFQAITLTAPGSVSLHRVGIRPTFFTQASTKNRGSFRSSDVALNEIWDLGAYTLELDQVPKRSLPPTWTVTPEGVDIKDSTYAVYQTGTNWTNYTASFDTKVVSREAVWLVLSTPLLLNWHLVLAADDDTMGTPNALRVYAPTGSTPLVQAALPFDLKPDTWHHVRTVVAGTKISVYLDNLDQAVLAFEVPPGFASGSVGFAGYDHTEGCFRNLLVTDASGHALYQSGLNNSEVLDSFTAGSNVEPAIIDGAKRDRYIWSGDIGIAGPTIYYSNGASDYVKGSLRLFGNYQRSNGEVPGDLPPQLWPSLTPTDQMPDIYFYSLSYSIYFVTSLYDYYLYTGDKAFVEEEWPVVERELAYLQANSNALHLVVTDATNGYDWHPQDNKPLIGTVTEFNVLYYQALRGAAWLARATNRQNLEAVYEAEATLVKNAVNSTLFDANAGLYVISDQLRGHVPQDANSVAVLFGVAPNEKAVSILQRLGTALNTTNGPLAFSTGSGLSNVISPFVSGFEAQARFEVGDTTGALNLIRTVWGHMCKGSAFYSGATWETLAPDATPAFGASTSLAHGWASGPTSALSKYVLGVRPVTAGYKTWLIEPQSGDLSWANGRVPTPYGPIEVEWEKQGNSFVLEFSIPNGTSATVGVPFSENAGSVMLNGQNVKVEATTLSSQGDAGRPGYGYVRDLAAGTYRIVAPQ
jgi:alpha-L-rhamnosidase